MASASTTPERNSLNGSFKHDDVDVPTKIVEDDEFEAGQEMDMAPEDMSMPKQAPGSRPVTSRIVA